MHLCDSYGAEPNAKISLELRRGGLSTPLPPAGGGSMMGEGARDGCVEWMLSVLNGPRNGLADGVTCAVWGRERTAEGWTCGAAGVKGGCGTALYCACGGKCEPRMGSFESVLMGDGESSCATLRWRWW